MKTLLIAASALALSTPALAQMEQTVPGQSTTQPTTPQTDPMTTQQPAAPTTATPQDPKALIASEFPTYDKDGNGNLNKAEFSVWIGALKEKADGKPTPAAEMTKFADGAFATADTDKSKTVTLAELQTYLTRGA